VIAAWVDVRGLMMEPRDTLEAMLVRRALAVSALLGATGYYVRTLLISELVFAPLAGTPACLIGNCFVALGWTALLVGLVYSGARLTGHPIAEWSELFVLWGYTEVPAIIGALLTFAAVLLVPTDWRRDLDVNWLLLEIAVLFTLWLWGLRLKLHAVRVWSGRSGWPLARMVFAVVLLYGGLAWGEHVALVERGLVPGGALRAMEPTVAPFVARPDVVALPFDRLTYLVRPPRRGDIVSFVRAGQDDGFWSSIVRTRVRFVGRILGVPGDLVQVRHGDVLLNTRALDEPYRVGGGNWTVPATTVERDHYFILGDNRDVRPEEYDGGLVRSNRVRGRLTELGQTKWGFVLGRGRW
jgi:signal peptidase I